MTYLLGTNIVSETRKPGPDPSVIDWLRSVPMHSVFLSVLVLGELRIGVERMRRHDSPQAEALDQWLSGLRRSFETRIIPIDEKIAERWAGLNVPDRLNVVDSLQAATALVYDWTFVTRNVRDVKRTGVKVLNPFEHGG